MLGNVSVSISGEMDNSAVKTIIESTVSALLTEINDAQAAGRAIELGAMDMTTWAQEYITTLLNNYSLFMLISHRLYNTHIVTLHILNFLLFL